MFFLIPVVFSFLIFPTPWKKTQLDLRFEQRNTSPDDLVVEARVPKKIWEVFLTETLPAIPFNLRYFDIFVENKSSVKDCSLENQTEIAVGVIKGEIKKYDTNCSRESSRGFSLGNNGEYIDGFIIPFGEDCIFRVLVGESFNIDLVGGFHTCPLDGNISLIEQSKKENLGWSISARPYFWDWIAKEFLVFIIWWGMVLILIGVIRFFREVCGCKKQ
ncbi:hypothetical protein L6252_00395 [Candidatus Parcubacteria bacterium]|nr:hypothetical protein [Candidatus Parcubacteria bacterium]